MEICFKQKFEATPRETKGCGFTRSSNRIQGFFVKKPSVLLSAGGTTVHVSTTNSQGEKKVRVERNQLWLFLSRSPVSSWALVELPLYMTSHLQGSCHILTLSPLWLNQHIKCTKVLFTHSLYTVAVNNNIKTLEEKKSLCPGKQFLELSFCQFASFCQSLWYYNLFCKYCCTASRLVLFTTRHMHHLPPSCDGEHACAGIDLLSWLKAMCDC